MAYQPLQQLQPHSSPCSDTESDHEDPADKSPANAAIAMGPQDQDLEGSKTKYLPPERESDEEQEPQAAAGGKGPGPINDGKGEYVDLELPKGGEATRSKKDKSPVEYVKVKPNLSAPLPPPPPAVRVFPATGIVALRGSINYIYVYLYLYSSVYSFLSSPPPSTGTFEGNYEE